MRLYYYFLSPFIPFKTLQEFSREKNKDQFSLFIFALHILIFTGIYHFIPKSMTSYSETQTILLYTLGLTIRLIMIAFILNLLVEKIIKQKLGFRISLNLALLCSLPGVLGISFALYDIHFYETMYFIGHLWSMLVLGIGIWYITESKPKNVILTISLGAVFFTFITFVFEGLVF